MQAPVLDTDYFETFNRDHVTSSTCARADRGGHARPASAPTQGLYELDVIVFATGFDAMTGALDRIDIRGRDGRRCATTGPRAPRTLLGIETVGFPNLFTVTGPGSPAVLATWSCALEQQVGWIAECLVYLREHGFTADRGDAARRRTTWVDARQRGRGGHACSPPTCNSWYLGDNIPGKLRVFLPYVGGLPRYIERCDAIVAAGYEGFELS